MHPILSLRAVLPAAALLTVAACAGDPTPVAPSVAEPELAAAATEVTPIGLVTCQASVASPTVRCGAIERSGVDRPAVLLGGQGNYVTLVGSHVVYSDGVWGFRATATNLLSQRLGSTDGINADDNGIRLVLMETPAVTAGTGSISVNNATGNANYTAINQSYWQVAGNLARGATSDSTRIRFNVPAGVTTFTFRMLVAAAIPQEAGVLRWDSVGTELRSDYMSSISCTGPSHCVSVGEGAYIRVWNGTNWSAATNPDWRGLTGVSCLSPTSCFAFGYQGVRLRWNGTTWAVMVQEGEDLEGGSCLSSDFCLAVGTSGRIVSWNGTSWANVSHGLTTNTLRRVHCASENYCVAVGFGGVVLRRVDGTWGTQSSGTTNDLFGIHCVNANFCVAVGLNEIRIWNGTDWRNPAGDLGATGSPFNSTSWRGVSCTSASLCTVVGLEGSSGAQVGAVGGFDGTRWARHMPSAGRWLIDISCTTGPLFCMTASGKTFRGTR